jgi:hypothetical protein
MERSGDCDCCFCLSQGRADATLDCGLRRWPEVGFSEVIAIGRDRSALQKHRMKLERHSAGERFRIVTARLGMQSMLTDLPRNTSSTEHFQPHNRLSFAFRVERTANLNRADCKALTSRFCCEILCQALPICNLRAPRGLVCQNGTEGSNPTFSAMR